MSVEPAQLKRAESLEVSRGQSLLLPPTPPRDRANTCAKRKWLVMTCPVCYFIDIDHARCNNFSYRQGFAFVTLL